MTRSLAFLAVILTALALVPGGAHLAALPNKIGMAQEPYFIAQGIYQGWALFGVVTLSAPLATLAFAIAARKQPHIRNLALLATALLVATLAIFFAWTFPANQATANWTVAPEHWQTLRTQWEYSHAANAVLTFVALCVATCAALMAR